MKRFSEEINDDVNGERNSVFFRSVTHGKRLSEENNDDDDDVKKCNLSRSLSPIGRGKMMVEFFSAAIPLKVWRYLRKTCYKILYD